MVQTLRFDDAAAIQVDLAESHGVLGQTRQGSTLYVALDSAVEPVRLVVGGAGSPVNALVGLRDSRWQVSELTRDGADWRFDAQGFGPGDFAWDHAAPGRYRVAAHRDDAPLWSADVESDALGRLSFSVPVPAVERLSITVARQSNTAGGAP
jgi:hypothetical protein